MSPSRTLLAGERAFTVTGFLAPDACAEWIRRTEAIGYSDAPISTDGGPVLAPEIRDNTRVMFDDVDEAAQLWDLARDFVPAGDDGAPPIGLNERFRFYRYEEGQQFDWHTDGSFERDNGERSRMTLLVYLNGDFTGGETSFLLDDPGAAEAELSVRPETGLALFFEHPFLHKGEPVTAGRKYVLRTDVMYARA